MRRSNTHPWSNKVWTAQIAKKAAKTAFFAPPPQMHDTDPPFEKCRNRHRIFLLLWDNQEGHAKIWPSRAESQSTKPQRDFKVSWPGSGNPDPGKQPESYRGSPGSRSTVTPATTRAEEQATSVPLTPLCLSGDSAHSRFHRGTSALREKTLEAADRCDPGRATCGVEPKPYTHRANAHLAHRESVGPCLLAQ